MTITHIFFDLHGTLVDTALLESCYTLELGRILAERFGSSPEAWAAARRRILSDWDSYYADLDLDGDEGIDDMWEGMFRITRAHFRLTGTPEPDLDTLTTLSRQLPYLASSRCDTFYPDAEPVVERLFAAGYVLGVASQVVAAQARGILTGAGVIDYFGGAFLCPDVTGRFSKDAAFFLSSNLPPDNCLVVDDTPHGIVGAKAAGMHTVQIARGEPPTQSPADYLLCGDLSGLLTYLSLAPK